MVAKRGQPQGPARETPERRWRPRADEEESGDEEERGQQPKGPERETPERRWRPLADEEESGGEEEEGRQSTA